MLQRPRTLSADAKAWKLVAIAMVIILFAEVIPSSAQGQTQYPPLSEARCRRTQRLRWREASAPSNVSDRATIKVFNESGYEVAIEGDNGFVCMVMRAWSAPTYTPEAFLDFVYYAPLRAPICFNPVAAETMMPYYELRTE